VNLSNLKRITTLAEEYRILDGALSYSETCYWRTWNCTAGNWSVPIKSADIGPVLLKMRNEVEAKLRDLGVTEFDYA